MNIKNKFSLGDTVFLVTDPEQMKRLIVGITVLPGGILMYSCAHADEEVTDHYEMELSDTEDVLLKIGDK